MAVHQAREVLASHLLVNEEEATEGNAFWRQHIVLLHNLALQVGHQWVCKVTNTALVAVCMHPASYCLACAFGFDSLTEHVGHSFLCKISMLPSCCRKFIHEALCVDRGT